MSVCCRPLLTLGLIFRISALCVFAQTELRVEFAHGSEGDTVQLPISFQSEGSQVALQFDLTFDPLRLALDEPAIAETIGTDHILASNDLGAGHWRIVIYSPTNALLDTGLVAHLPVTVRPNPPIGVIPVVPTAPIVQSDGEGNPSMPAAVSGGISVGDLDLDGVGDVAEDGSPNDGDFNGDGVADSAQSHVASLANAVDGRYVVLETSPDASLMQVMARNSPSAVDQPAEVEFPVGFLEYRIEGLVPGGSQTVVLRLPEGVVANRFYQYGPTQEDASAHWYEFLFDGVSGTEFDGNRVLIHFQDGARGDHDLTVNGRVAALGGPGVGDPFVLLLPFYRGEEGSFTGFAISNWGPRISNITYNAYGTDGRLLATGSNPAPFQLAGRTQLARQGFQIFNADINSDQLGWVELLSDNDQIGSFFQFGTDTLSQLDGSVAFLGQSQKLIFSRIFQGPEAFRGQGADTRLSVINPNAEPIEFSIRLVGVDGQTVAEVERELAARAMLFETVQEIFGEGTEVDSGYIEVDVTSGEGAIGFEQIQLRDQETIIGLNAHFENDAVHSFSAQLASQTELFTNVNLINTSAQARTATLTAIREDGSHLSAPVQINLEPGEEFSEDAAQLFGAQDFVASLRVEADGPGVLGDVIFGDKLTFNYAAALPLQSETFLDAIFSQVANVPGFFTGLAFYNPNAEAAEMQIEVVSAAGITVGMVTQIVEGGERLARLVDQLVPDSAGQAGGYVRIRADRPMIAQMLFGAVKPQGITLFSAVPPAVIE